LGRDVNEASGNALTPDFFSKGEPLTGLRSKLNALVTVARADRTGVSPPRQRDESGLKLSPTVQQFTVVEVQGDYLICNPRTGNTDTDATRIFVAKPYLLRTSITTRDSIDYVEVDAQSRVATNADADTEDQVIVPSYVVDDIIYAINTISGGTDVESGSQTQTQEEIEWIDLNVDGRAWAKSAVAF